MAIHVMNGTASGPALFTAEELAVLRLANLAAFFDFNDSSSITFDASNRVSRIANKALSTSYLSPGITPTSTWMTLTDIGSDGQRGVLCGSNRGVMISNGSIFPSSGSFTLMAITQQTAALDGFQIASGEEASGVSGGPFAFGWHSTTNQLRVYSALSTALKAPAGYTNDGGVCCHIICYDSVANELLCHKDGVLISTETSVGAPARTDRRMCINGYRSGGSYTGQLDGVGNLYVVVNQFCDTGSAELTALMDLANARFPTEAWGSL